MKQPKALPFLFLTEMWERYGFYIIEGLLIFYLLQSPGVTDKQAYAILGEFTALAYISPIIGGYLADRILGFRTAVIIGAVLLCAGYILLATTVHSLLFIGLASIIMGNAFLKPNISSFLGNFYEEKDPRRDAGFTLFYMGINIGGMLSTLASGFIQRAFGWEVCFGVGAFGMLLAIATFCYGFKTYGKHGLPIRTSVLNLGKIKGFLRKISTPLAILLGLIASYFLLQTGDIGDWILTIVGVIVLGALLVVTMRLEKNERKPMLLLILLIAVSIFFWALFFQIYFSINLFIKRTVDLHLFGLSIPPVVFIGLESAFTISLAPLFAMGWSSLQRQKVDLSVISKFAFALFAVALGLFILYFATHFASASAPISPFWILLAYLPWAMGELFLSPIGLSAVTTLAPKRLVGWMMGVWFLSLGFGGSLAALLATKSVVPHAMIKLGELSAIKGIYAHAFLFYALLAAGIGVVVWLVSFRLKGRFAMS